MGGEQDDPPAEDESAAEGPLEPMHDPFCIKVFTTIKVQQNLNGLRHNDHLRYRQYCSRLLRRFYKKLGLKHGRGRYKQEVFPANFKDKRFVLLLLVRAERAWSYGVQLKADNANAATFNPRWRHHSIMRFAKAVHWARQLETVGKVHCDQRTQVELEAYVAFIEGTYLLEKESWAEAYAKLLRCRKLCEHLGLAAEQEDAAHFKTHREDIAPMLRECKYHLGEDYKDVDEDSKEVKPARTKDSQDGLSYRGHGLNISTDKIKVKLLTCVEGASSLKAQADTKEINGTDVNEKYGELGAEFADVLRDIHHDMIAAGADGETAEWRMLEAYARELSICLNVERNIANLQTLLGKLDDIEEVASSEARRNCRPEEGMRFCDLIKEDLENLSELPETSHDVKDILAAFTRAVLNYRCLFLGLCNTLLGKSLEAAALLDMLHARVEEQESFGSTQAEPLGRLQALFDQVCKSLPARVAQWRCRGLAQIFKASRAKGKDAQAEAATSLFANQKLGEDASSLVAFPPRFRDIPCKPLLFDLAFPYIVQPDLEEILPTKRATSEGPQKAGILGRVAGGLGNKLGGFFGRK